MLHGGTTSICANQVDPGRCMQAELLFLGATVVDGTGGETYAADVAVGGGQIAAIGDLKGTQSRRVIDAAGKVLCPGFIDICSHSDLSLLRCPDAESKVRQGVTTDVTGNCGFSAFPFSREKHAHHAEHLMTIEETALGLVRWEDLEGYADAVSRLPPAINVIPIVGHGAVRIAAMGADARRPTDAELSRMRALVRESLEQGAFGFSTGLSYVPSSYADETEVRALVEVVAEAGALWAAHPRSTGSVFRVIGEAIATASSVGARIQTHAGINEPDNWGRAGDFVAMFETAEKQGLDVGFDVYPYEASATPLTQCLPPWVQAGGIDAMRTRLRDPALRARAESELSKGFMGAMPWIWDRVLISRTGPMYQSYVGMTIEAAAKAADKPPLTLVMDLCIEGGNSAYAILFYRNEADMVAFLTHRLALVGSDGNATSIDDADTKSHPRSYGTFPRVLGRYVRERQALSLAEAVHKMTGLPAKRLGVKDRGIVRRGLAADLVIFDPGEVIDTATFAKPASAPKGVSHVMVNGVLVIDDGKMTTARPGRVLRRR